LAFSFGLLRESLPILDRGDERLDHLDIDVVIAKLIQLVEPEVIAAQVWVRSCRRIPTEIAEILPKLYCSRPASAISPSATEPRQLRNS